MLLSTKTSDALDELVGAMFDQNRSWDRAVSWLQNKFSMPQAADIIHHNIAHLWPLLADEISGFKDQYNMPTRYPATHEDNRTYADLYDMMETLLKEASEVYEMIKITYRIAKEEGDFNANAMLQKLMRQMTVVIGQVYTLRDKAEQMPIDYDTYDAHIDDWGIDGLDLNNMEQED